MKKLFQVIRLAVLVAVVLIAALPQGVFATGGVIDSDTASAHFQNADNVGRRCTFYDEANSRQWVFYLEGYNIVYRTRPDGGNWTAQTTSGQTVGSLSAAAFSIDWDGEHLTIVSCAGGVIYRLGVPASDGLSIAWMAGSQTVVSGNCYRPCVALDSSERPWVTFTLNNGASITPYAYRSSLGNGTWSTDVSHQLSTTSVNWSTTPVALAANKIVVLYGVAYGGGTLYGQMYSGSWQTAKHTTAALYQKNVSAVTYNDKAIISFATSATTITATSFNGATNSFGAETTIASGISGGTYPGSMVSKIGLGWQEICWIDGDEVLGSLTRDGGATWGGAYSIGNDTLSATDKCILAVNAYNPAFPHDVFFCDTSNDLKTFSNAGAGIANMPYATMNPATNILESSADLNIHIEDDGAWADHCTVTAYWQGAGFFESGVSSGNATYGSDVYTGQDIQIPVTGLIPNALYAAWAVISSEAGSSYTNTINFQTASPAGPSPVVVDTRAATLITDTSAQLNGYLWWAGGSGNGGYANVGFQYKVYGDSDWISCWNRDSNGALVPEMSGTSFSGTLAGLTLDTVYAFRAQAQSVSTGNTSYGNITPFVTLHTYVPTTTPGGGIIPPGLVPPGVGVWFNSLSGIAKLIMALLITVGGALFIGLRTGRTKSSGMIVGAWLVASIIGFVVLGWYPQWVVIFLGILGVVALIVILTGNRK